MPKLPQRGAAQSQQAKSLEVPDLNWDDLRVLLACAETETFRGAARELKIDAATVTRRIDRLEHSLGTRLFLRTPGGVRLTEEAKAIVCGAKGMHRALCDIGRKRSFSELLQKTTVALAITEGLGSYWLMPQLVRFQRENPTTEFTLTCAMASVDVLRLEADIAVQFERPTSPDLIICRLGKLHLSAFASPDYISSFGMPFSREDFVNHSFVQQAAPNLDDAAFAGFFGLDETELSVALRTNASTAHLYAVEKGAGVGVLPNYALALGASVVPVTTPSRYALDIWLTYHPDIQHDAAKARVIAWIREAFSPTKYPWFGNDYLDPDECRSAIAKDLLDDGVGFLATGNSREWNSIR
jgi:DNA-binding transcriptional LysR family regulator